MREGLVLAAGLFDLACVLLHLMFWRLFGWPETLRAAGHRNAATAEVLNIMLTYVFAVFGAALLWAGGAAPAALLLAGAGFFALRAALQPLFFGLAGAGSRALALLSTLGSVLHLVPVLIG